MSLSAVYQQFLSAPNPATLANDATLSYVTTLTTFSDSAQIIKHLGAQQKVLRKKSEKVLNAFENDRAVFLEVESIIEFISGGGAYLPGLDDNFLADRIVEFPTLHVVHFDPQGKIQQVRIYWDQGSLLKVVEVIGSRGKNWPIKDGKDQIKLIASSGRSRSSTNTSESSSRKESTSRAKGPNRTIEAFGAYTDVDPEKTPTFKSPPVAPRASARPAPRDLGDLFVGGEQDDISEGPPSPTKSEIIAPKFGAGKNYHGNRLFDDTPGGGLEKYISPHPTKYNHFEFADGHDEPAPKPTAPPPRTKHQSQWDFEDFTTPAKVPQRRGEARQFTLGDDAADDTPVHKPSGTGSQGGRRDAATHFELKDDGEAPEHEQRKPRPGHSRGLGSANTSSSLFTNNVISSEGANDTTAKGARPTSMAYSQKDRSKDFDAHWQMTDDPQHGTNPNNAAGHGGPNVKDRHRDFDPHFSMTDKGDQQPGLGERSANERNKGRPMGESKSKAVKMMEAQWENRDTASPVNSATGGMGGGKENVPEKIKTGGDGMGGRKGTGRQWGFGDDDGAGLQENKKPARKVDNSNQRSQGGWGFGDDDGGGLQENKKPARKVDNSNQRSQGGWGFGEDDQPGLQENVRPQRKVNNNNQPSQGGFWDY